MKAHPLVLASASPRRQALLRAAEVPFTVIAAEIDETPYHSGPPRAAAMKTALAKADAVAATLPPGRLVLAADTMVVLEGEILNKPRDRDHARAMLRKLSARRHTVVTGLAVLETGASTSLDAASAEVTFNTLGNPLIERFVNAGEADDKAGAYGIQGPGAEFVAAVEGDMSCVIGLPLVRLAELFAQATGEPLLGALAPRAIALAAFPDLRRLPAQCLDGLPAVPLGLPPR